MILTKEVEMKINNRYVKYYKDKGYDVKGGDEIIVDVKDLPNNSHINVNCICDICSAETSIKYYNYCNNISNGGYYVCNKCKKIKIEKTNLERYGVKSTLLEKNTMLKIKDSILEKYGEEHYSKTDNFKNRLKKSNLEKYGVEYYFQTDDIKKKRKDKFGFDYFSQSPEYKNKYKETILEKYGEEHYSKTKEFKDSIKDNIKLKYKLKYNFDIIDITDNILTIKCNKNHQYKIHKWLLKHRLNKYHVEPCTICNPINSFTYSGKENKLLDFIKKNYNGNIIVSDRKILNGKELDIYLPELKLAFEFNGLWWHNELYKDKNYHLDKTESCLEKGIRLIHIWEDDWNYKQEIVKSIILNNLDKCKKIKISDCEIKEIFDNQLVKEFLNENHINAFINSSIKIGLFNNNELISLIVFRKDKENYELLRFCNKLFYDIDIYPLFNYFINNYKFTNIITYIDNYSNQFLYEKLGFKFINKTINYYYVIDGIRKHKFNFSKNILVKEGYDKNKTEHEIMRERKIYKIYDSGHLKLIF